MTIINKGEGHETVISTLSNAIEEQSAMYLDNKYAKIYYNIVNRAKYRIRTADHEEHHIIPESFFKIRIRKGTPGWLDGDSNSSDNLVYLTAKEHLMCHKLLPRFTVGLAKQKMSFALWGMTHRSDQKINSSSYHKLRLEVKKTLRDLRTGTKASEETKELHRISRKGNKNPMFGKKGINCPHTGKKRPDHSKKMSGNSNPFYNKTHSDDVMSILKLPKLRVSCIHCKKDIGGVANLIRWHEKCFREYYVDK